MKRKNVWTIATQPNQHISKKKSCLFIESFPDLRILYNEILTNMSEQLQKTHLQRHRKTGALM